MARWRGVKEKKSAAKLAAARANARLPRPGKTRVARRVREAAEATLVKQALADLKRLLPEATQLAQRVLADPKVALRHKLFLCREVWDRAGIPRQSESGVSISAEPAKLIEIRAFAPPASWLEESEPPGLEDAQLVEPPQLRAVEGPPPAVVAATATAPRLDAAPASEPGPLPPWCPGCGEDDELAPVGSNRWVCGNCSLTFGR